MMDAIAVVGACVVVAVELLLPLGLVAAEITREIVRERSRR